MKDNAGTDLDDATLAALRAAVGRVDPLPEHVREAAVAAFAWRDVDAALAELTYDSLTDERPLAGVRGGDGPRLVTFEAPELTVEVEVAPHGRQRRVVGQLVPPAEARVEVHHGGRTSGTDADALGRFAIDRVDPGPVRISCALAGSGHRVRTDWVTL